MSHPRQTSQSSWLRRLSPGGKRRGIAFWFLMAAVALFLLNLLPGIGSHVGFLSWAALLIALLASPPSLFHWLRWRLLWKLRNRLLVTYFLIGLTPVVLAGLLAGIAAYILFGQFANFAATSEINTELSELAANNHALALHFQQEMIAQLSHGGSRITNLPAAVPPEAKAIVNIPGLRVGVYLDGRLQHLDLPPELSLTSVATPPAWAQGIFRGLILSNDHVYFRAITRQQAGAHTVSVITSLPLDSGFLSRVAHGLGRITLLSKVQIHGHDLKSSVPSAASRRNIYIAGKNAAPPGQSDRSDNAFSDLGTVAGGDLPKAANIFDIPINFPTTLETTQWSTGKQIGVIAVVRSRPSLLYTRLFRESLLIGGGIRIALTLTAVLFALLELLAIVLAARLSRTITSSVSNLYHATREVDQGRLNYRIPVSRQDQLAALSSSFNTMSASLVRLLEEQKEKERLQGELAIAQEVQSNLFPSCDVHLGRLELHGVCRPARSVSGDYYDFLVLGNDALCLAIGDISGKGISAALLMAGLHSAVRAYRFASQEMLFADPNAALPNGPGNVLSSEVFQSPGNVMRMLNLHLYRSTQPEKYATLFLAYYDAATRTIRYSNGGQLPPLLLRANGTILRMHEGGTVVGLLDNMQYAEGAVELESGDLLVAYSDGVTEPENEFGDFGEERLVELVHRHRHLPLEEISSRVLQALQEWIGAAEQPDDITLVLARQT
ncbi:MAG TPA: SpoIIE family protein phosphatase [Acidobacteriaceae bacterium]|nr:SpoIIE family protein phosphatase [Acidobacteriaceae bacterium]